jgi:hypothetical protein
MAAALALSLLWTAASAYEFLIKDHSKGEFSIGPAGWYFRTAVTLQYSAAAAVVLFVTAFMFERVWPGLNRSAGTTGPQPTSPPGGPTAPLQLEP